MPRKEGRLLQEGKDRMLQERQEGLQEKEKSLQKGLQAAKRSSKELLQRQITTLTWKLCNAQEVCCRAFCLFILYNKSCVKNINRAYAKMLTYFITEVSDLTRAGWKPNGAHSPGQAKRHPGYHVLEQSRPVRAKALRHGASIEQNIHTCSTLKPLNQLSSKNNNIKG